MSKIKYRSYPVTVAPCLPLVTKSNTQFLAELQRFSRHNRFVGTLMPPYLAGGPIDLRKLYNEVAVRGGHKQVTATHEWSKVYISLGLPPGCVEAGHGLRNIYQRYLEPFERNQRMVSKSAFVTDGSENCLNLDTESQDADNSFRTIQAGQGDHIANHLRESWGLSTDLVDRVDYSELEYSLLSRLPNELDFALNTMLLMSSQPNGFSLHKNDRLLSLLLQSVGIHDPHCHLESTAQRRYGGFWNAVVLDPHGRVFLDPEVFGREHPCSAKPQATGEVSRNLLELHDMAYGDDEGFRVQLVATVLRNLAVEGGLSAVCIGRDPRALRFIFLCIYAAHSSLRQLGLETLCSLNFPVVDALLPALRHLIPALLTSPDRNARLRGLQLVRRLCEIPIYLSCSMNSSTVTQQSNVWRDHPVLATDRNIQFLADLPPVTFHSITATLSLRDLHLVVLCLDTLHSLTALGPLLCDRLVSMPPNPTECHMPHQSPVNMGKLLPTLIAMLQIEAQSMGSESLIRVRVMQALGTGNNAATVLAESNATTAKAIVTSLSGEKSRSSYIHPVVPITTKACTTPLKISPLQVLGGNPSVNPVALISSAPAEVAAIGQSQRKPESIGTTNLTTQANIMNTPPVNSVRKSLPLATTYTHAFILPRSVSKPAPLTSTIEPAPTPSPVAMTLATARYVTHTTTTSSNRGQSNCTTSTTTSLNLPTTIPVMISRPQETTTPPIIAPRPLGIFETRPLGRQSPSNDIVVVEPKKRAIPPIQSSALTNHIRLALLGRHTVGVNELRPRLQSNQAPERAILIPPGFRPVESSDQRVTLYVSAQPDQLVRPDNTVMTISSGQRPVVMKHMESPTTLWERRAYMFEWLRRNYAVDNRSSVARVQIYSDYQMAHQACVGTNGGSPVPPVEFHSELKNVFPGIELIRVQTDTGSVEIHYNNLRHIHSPETGTEQGVSDIMAACLHSNRSDAASPVSVKSNKAPKRVAQSVSIATSELSNALAAKVVRRTENISNGHIDLTMNGSDGSPASAFVNGLSKPLAPRKVPLPLSNVSSQPLPISLDRKSTVSNCPKLNELVSNESGVVLLPVLATLKLQPNVINSMNYDAQATAALSVQHSIDKSLAHKLSTNPCHIANGAEAKAVIHSGATSIVNGLHANSRSNKLNGVSSVKRAPKVNANIRPRQPSGNLMCRWDSCDHRCSNTDTLLTHVAETHISKGQDRCLWIGCSEGPTNLTANPLITHFVDTHLTVSQTRAQSPFLSSISPRPMSEMKLKRDIQSNSSLSSLLQTECLLTNCADTPILIPSSPESPLGTPSDTVGGVAMTNSLAPSKEDAPNIPAALSSSVCKSQSQPSSLVNQPGEPSKPSPLVDSSPSPQVISYEPPDLWSPPVSLSSECRRALNNGVTNAIPFVPVPPREGPVTKHIRLTAALTLRNLLQYSRVARRRVSVWESLLCELAFSALESSPTIMDCLQLLHNSDDVKSTIPRCTTTLQKTLDTDFLTPNR